MCIVRCVKDSVVVISKSKLWQTSDILRGSLDSSAYKYVVLGLIFIKYLSDSFEEGRKKIRVEKYSKFSMSNEEIECILDDSKIYNKYNILFIKQGRRWSDIIHCVNTNGNVGKFINNILNELGEDYKSLSGISERMFESISNNVLYKLINLINSISLSGGDNYKDILGEVYEYFLSQFASTEGKRGGEFYTPTCIVRLLVELIKPFTGTVYDPACGSGGMFVQAEKFVEEHGKDSRNISIYGQEKNETTWRLAKMNLTIKNIEANFGNKWQDVFIEDLHSNMLFDYILVNPPFNQSDYEYNPNDSRYKYGIPSKNNANYAWLQHIISKLNNNGIAGVVLAEGSLSSSKKAELAIRKNFIRNDLVEAIVRLPNNLFYGTGVSAAIWILNKNKNQNLKNKICFIDASKLGHMVTRSQRELQEKDIKKIVNAFDLFTEKQEFIYNLSAVVNIDKVIEYGYSLNPGLYIEYDNEIETEEEIRKKIKLLKLELQEKFKESAKLTKECNKILNDI